jgi:hypothetical protein
MKLKPIMSKENQTTYNEARYNPNVNGTHLFYVKGIHREDKKVQGNLLIFSLMSISGYIDAVKSENPNISPDDLVNKMISNAETFVSEYSSVDVKEL